MHLDPSNFDRVWTHIVESTKRDCAERALIPSLGGRGGNYVTEVITQGSNPGIMVRSKRPQGKGFRQLSRQSFYSLWDKLRTGGLVEYASSQVLWAILIRYFEDVDYDDSKGLVWLGHRRSHICKTVRVGPIASSPGGTSTIYLVEHTTRETQEIHHKVHKALWSLIRRSGSWSKDRLPRQSSIIPDLVVRTSDSTKQIIFEIKSTAEMHDLYEGIGQLYFYKRFFWPSSAATSLALILPARRLDMMTRRVFKDLGICIVFYSWNEGTPTFSMALRRLLMQGTEESTG